MRCSLVRGQSNQKVDISCACIGIGGGGGTYSADNVRITSLSYWIKEPQIGVCTGTVGESKHYCAGDRRKHCEFVRGNYVYFHRIYGCAKKKSKPYAKSQRAV